MTGTTADASEEAGAPGSERGPVAFLKAVFAEFGDDDCARMAAALSYYTVFALPPLLVLTLMAVGSVFDPASVQAEVVAQVRSIAGAQAAEQVTTMIETASRPGTGGPLAAALGVLALLFGATGAFAQLQEALNRAWDVEESGPGGIVGYLAKRAMSFAMIAGFAFLMLVSLLVSAALSAFGASLGGWLPAGISAWVLRALSLGLSFAVITLLIAAIFKVLPDVKIGWREVWTGAAVTALLFTAGKFLIGLYLGRSDPGSDFGAAGSLAVLLVWVYYNAIIFFLGAEFTQVWARRRGRAIRGGKSPLRVM